MSWRKIILPQSFKKLEDTIQSDVGFKAWQEMIEAEKVMREDFIALTIRETIRVLSLYPPEELAKTVKDLAKEIK